MPPVCAGIIRKVWCCQESDRRRRRRKERRRAPRRSGSVPYVRCSPRARRPVERSPRRHMWSPVAASPNGSVWVMGQSGRCTSVSLEGPGRSAPSVFVRFIARKWLTVKTQAYLSIFLVWSAPWGDYRNFGALVSNGFCTDSLSGVIKTIIGFVSTCSGFLIDWVKHGLRW